MIALNVAGLAFTADGATLASSHFDHTIRLWDTATGTNRVVPQPAGAAMALDISANGRFLATGAFDNQLLVSEAATGKKRWESGVPLDQTEPAPGLAFTPDGKQLVLVRKRRVELWELEKLIQATPDELAGPKERPAVEGAQPSPGNLPSSIEAHIAKNPKAPYGVLGLGLSADGKTLITTGRDRALRIWDLASGTKQAEKSIGMVQVDVAVNPDGKTVAVAVQSAVYLYDTKTAEMLATLTPDAQAIVAMKMPPDVLERVKRTNNGEVPPPGAGAVKITALAFAPDGKTLAVACSGVIELWDTAAKKVRRRFVLEGGAGHLAFAPDGGTLATCIGNWMANDPVVRLYDVPTGRLLARLRGFKGSANTVAYSADGRYLAAAGGGPDQNQMVLVWDANSGQELKRFLHRQEHHTLSLAFSPDGKTLAWGQVGEVHVHDVASGQRIGTFLASAACLLFGRDNQVLIAGTGSGKVELWNVARLPRPKPAAQNKPPARSLASGVDLQHIGNVEPCGSAPVGRRKVTAV